MDMLDLAELEEDRPNRIILLVAPLIPELIKCLWMIPCMDIFELCIRFFPNRPVDFILVFQEDIKDRAVCLMNNAPFPEDFKCKAFIEVVPKPCLIISGVDIFF